MATYEVILREINEYVVPVEADNEDDAIEMAWEIIMEDEKNRDMYFSDSEEGECQAYELDDEE